jgi:peptidyl-tRNA hydrolase
MEKTSKYCWRTSQLPVGCSGKAKVLQTGLSKAVPSVHFCRYRFGISKDMTVNELKRNVLSKLNVSEKSSIVMFCNKNIIIESEKLKSFIKYAEPDGFIYFYIG